MVEFNIGSSRIFGSADDVSEWNRGTNFWGKDLFRFDGSIQDKANLLISVSDFVKILTGLDIPVRYAKDSDESFTDGKSITISSEVIPECLDSTIGLVLHEASHCAITDFQVLKDFVEGKGVPAKYRHHIRLIKNLFNWVEDRRIDNWAYNKAPGYQQYYDALYKRYFFNESISEILKEKKEELAEETFRNYNFFIINSMHPDVTMTELQGLAEIKKIIDLENVSRWKSSRSCLKTAYEIFDVILKYVKEPPDKSKGGRGVTKLDNILSDQEDFLNGKIKKQPISDKDTAELDGFNSNVSKYPDTITKNDKIKVICISHVTEAEIKGGVFHVFTANPGSDTDQYIKEGIRLGKLLARKLKFREEERKYKNVNQKSGRINKRALYSASFDNERLFYTLSDEGYQNLVVHITVDMSGSMGGVKWNKTLVALVAIAKATSMVNGIRTQISFRYSMSNEANLLCVYDSKRDKINKIELLKYARPTGGTPEGACYAGLVDKLLNGLLNNKTLLINFSDGAPMMMGMSTDEGVKITAEYIKKFRGLGLSILSYFITESKEVSSTESANFLKMYGDTAKFINVNSLNDLVKTINLKFLNMGKNF